MELRQEGLKLDLESERQKHREMEQEKDNAIA